MSNIVIIGSGPAGVSAALYTSRANIDTLVISNESSALLKAEKIENYYGFEEAISGKELHDNAIEGAKKAGARFVKEEVVGIGFEERLCVYTDKNKYSADSVIIATGASRKAPLIKGIAEFEGRGVSYCAVCDAFFYRGKNVAVIGNSSYALHEAKELLPVVNSVVLLTDGKPLEVETDIETINTKISEIIGNETVNGVLFEDNSKIEIDGLFVAIGVAGSTELAKKIGILTEKGKIVVDENMATNVPGIFSAGDCNGGLLQISKAVSEGAVAGTQAIKYIRGK
ncbi:MAG: thioredoxin reductase [Ruminococcaceae bacterium]|nr:thioredoxin reductase [Oscillospiraceae bacterium]